jgi:hypothetical protein
MPPLLMFYKWALLGFEVPTKDGMRYRGMASGLYFGSRHREDTTRI